MPRDESAFVCKSNAKATHYASGRRGTHSVGRPAASLTHAQYILSILHCQGYRRLQLGTYDGELMQPWRCPTWMRRWAREYVDGE